jgi:hypothetical protein
MLYSFAWIGEGPKKWLLTCCTLYHRDEAFAMASANSSVELVRSRTANTVVEKYRFMIIAPAPRPFAYLATVDRIVVRWVTTVVQSHEELFTHHGIPCVRVGECASASVPARLTLSARMSLPICTYVADQMGYTYAGQNAEIERRYHA